MKFNHIIKTTGFSRITFELNYRILENDFLTNAITELFNILYANTDSSRKFFIVIKLELESGTYKTLGKGRVIDGSQLSLYTEYILGLISMRGNDYTDSKVNKLIFNYFIIEKDREQYYSKNWSGLNGNDNKYVLFELDKINHYLPNNRDYLTWGKVALNTPELVIVYGSKGENYSIYPDRVEVYKNGQLMFSFVDSDFREGIWTRKMNESTFYLKDGEVVLTVTDKKTKYLKPLDVKKQKAIKIATFDIETLLKDGEMVPFLYSMYDGKDRFSWFTSSPQPLFDQLLRRKYTGYHVYAHNLSSFDAVFILKYIASLKNNYKVNIIKRDSNIIAIKIVNRKKNISITIKDSYLLLPASLNSLSTSFKCKDPKKVMPILSSTNNPSGKFYIQADLSSFTKEVVNYTDFKLWKSAIKDYCEVDCISLYQVLANFKDLVYENWQVNIEDYPTTPSLAFAIFRSHYLEDNTIPLTHDDVFKFIKTSFTGGSTEMYKPQGENIYVYDVNALYPSEMKKNEFPVGQIKQFHGDISIINPKYWIADVIAETKSDLHAPYLQIHHETDAGIRTVSPNGSFRMRIHSPEYYNALKDYNFSVNYGYFFDSKPLFSEYVDQMYNLRMQYPKGDPLNLIAKLLMNSLFGRFAMKPSYEAQMFCSFDELKSLLQNNKFELLDFIDLDEDGYFTTYLDTESQEDSLNVSIGIASAISAYGRVFMSQFKNNPDINNLYGDTDSLHTDKPLPDYLVGNELGKFKLEHVFKEVVYLAPKVYAGITTDGEYICKIKGYKDAANIPFEDMKTLLNKDSNLYLSQEKWYRNFDLSNILVKKEVYNLMATQNKRTLVYFDNCAVSTSPLKLEIKDNSKDS
jgi:hypothetical protein